MKVEVYGGEGYAANCYLLSDDAEREFALVDPSVSPAAIIERRGSLPPVRSIVLTHAHFDHMLYVNEWRELTHAPLAVHEAEASALSDGERNVYRLFTGKDGGTHEAEILLADGGTLFLGDEVVTVWHTPGHTPGSICLYADGVLLSGDTLFAGTIGRTDLPGGDNESMQKSLCRIFSFEKDVLLYSGHGPASSLAREKKYNPYANWEF